MPLTSEQMVLMEKLLDEALPLDEAARRRWLENLAPEYQDLLSALRQALLPDDRHRLRLAQFATLAKLRLDLQADLSSGPEPGTRVGPYELIRPLGAGGMAEVWLAARVDGAFKRTVALKLPLRSPIRKDLEQRFEREREILASLDHPNIAKLLDAGFTLDGQPYLALEYVNGTPLTTYCEERCLPIFERLELFRQVLSAVRYAHSNLILHRDLKPSNILVDEQGNVRLLDFGIAKLLIDGETRETELTQLSGRPLTPDYAAPEQILGAPITTAADVYSLGVVLYEILTGERPYKLKRETRGALEEAVLQVEPSAPSRKALSEDVARARGSSPRKLAKLIRGDLDTITLKALKKQPGDRYASVDAFHEDIARFRRGDVVLAQADTLAYRAIKFARRHRVGIAVTGLLILTLAVGLAATSYEAKVAGAQRDAALKADARLLTQAADTRLRDGQSGAALGIIFEVLRNRSTGPAYAAEALSVFQAARAQDAQVLAFTGHSDHVDSVAFSPDGRRVVSGSRDKSARIWDASSGQQLLMLSGHTGGLNDAQFSPDGREVVTAAADRTARLWDAASGKELRVLSGHTDYLASATFSPDGLRIVTAGGDRTARVWDAASGKQLLVLSGHTAVMRSAAYSADGKRIVTCAFDGTTRVWDATSGKQLLVINGPTSLLEWAAFSPDGRRIVTAAYDKTARIFDAASGLQLLVLNGHADGVLSASYSPDGRYVVTASLDRTARVWDASSGQQVRVLAGHRHYVHRAVFSPDGRRIVTAASDRTARVWDAPGSEALLVLRGHSEGLMDAVYSPDGARIVTASFDKTARVWDAASGEQRLVLRQSNLVTNAEFSADGRRIVTASNDLTARVWDAASSRPLQALEGHTGMVLTAAFSPDGSQIVTASYDGTARIWDAASGAQLRVLGGHSDRVLGAQFSPDGRRVVTASEDRTARLWDAASGAQLRVLSGHTDMVQTAAFSPDGRRIVTASGDKTARIWDAASGAELVVLSGHVGSVSSAAFSPDGLRIVTASEDRTARLWDAASGQQLRVLSGHTDFLANAAFSPDGLRVVTASIDGSARVWDATAPALQAQIAWAEAAQFDPLSATERLSLGLPLPGDVSGWPDDRSKCDESAAAPYDPDRRAPGVLLDQLTVDVANAACDAARESPQSRGRVRFQQGRILEARGDLSAAEHAFTEALALGYRSAGVDLGMLLAQRLSSAAAIERAISLYEQAWDRGVPMAAFELGRLYEHRVTRDGARASSAETGDTARAWLWYQRAANAGEPNALARFAESEEAKGFSSDSPAARHSHLLDAFKHYAAAAERARLEDWPDGAWVIWRYHRATLARLLAREVGPEEIADAYTDVRRQYAPARRPILGTLARWKGAE